MTPDPRIGIFTSVDWNSNHWKSEPDPEDIKNSKFEYVQDHGKTHTHLNFAYESSATDSQGHIYALLPQFWSKTPQSDNVQIVIVRSQDWKTGIGYIVGLYFLPVFKSKSPASEFPAQIDRVVNVKVLAKHVVLLDQFVAMNSANLKKFIPKDKELGKQGFNYLTVDNVLNILDTMTQANPENIRLSSVKHKFLQNNKLDIRAF